EFVESKREKHPQRQNIDRYENYSRTDCPYHPVGTLPYRPRYQKPYACGRQYRYDSVSHAPGVNPALSVHCIAGVERRKHSRDGTCEHVGREIECKCAESNK